MALLAGRVPSHPEGHRVPSTSDGKDGRMTIFTAFSVVVEPPNGALR